MSEDNVTKQQPDDDYLANVAWVPEGYWISSDQLEPIATWDGTTLYQNNGTVAHTVTFYPTTFPLYYPGGEHYGDAGAPEFVGQPLAPAFRDTAPFTDEDADEMRAYSARGPSTPEACLDCGEMARFLRQALSLVTRMARGYDWTPDEVDAFEVACREAGIVEMATSEE